MLEDEVVQAISEGKFNIWAINHVDQGIEILTGVPAGIKRKDGKFPAGTVHYLVDKQLKAWARKNRPRLTSNSRDKD